MREHRIGMFLQRRVIAPRVRAAAFVGYDQVPLSVHRPARGPGQAHVSIRGKLAYGLNALFAFVYLRYSGYHEAAWRVSPGDPAEVLDPRHDFDLARTAERWLAKLVASQPKEGFDFSRDDVEIRILHREAESVILGRPPAAPGPTPLRQPGR